MQLRCLWVAVLLLFMPLCIGAEPKFRVQQAVKSVTLVGYTRSQAERMVASEVSGRVETVHYDIGQTTGKKAAITVDQTFIDLELDSANQSIRRIDTALKKAQSRQAYLDKEFQRIDQLHQSDIATEVNRDAAAENLAQARLETQSLAQEKTSLQIRLAELKERKRRHRVFAPENWVVIERRVEPGEIISAGTPLLRIADYRRLIVPLTVSGPELTALKTLPEVFAARLESQPVQTAISWISPEFDEATRKLKVELILVGFSGPKRGGLSFELDLQTPVQGLMVPKTAVLNRYDNPRVVLDPSGDLIPILILGDSGNHFIVAENQRLRPGTGLQDPVR